MVELTKEQQKLVNEHYALLEQELKRDEGIRLKPYKDTEGILTIGVGRNLEHKGITESEARILFLNDVSDAIGDLDRTFPWWTQSLNLPRQRALINMSFNLGISRLSGFKKMLKALEEQRWQDAHDEALDSKWAKQVGRRAVRIAELFRDGE